MQTLHQEIDPSLHGATPEDSETPSQDEVRVLRDRVAKLEAALAAAQARSAAGEGAPRKSVPLTSIDFAPPCPSDPIATSEFTAPATPAVIAVSPAAPVATPVPAPMPQPEQAPSDATAISSGNVRFAEAWSEEDDASFEERVAEKAFFQASSVDQQSRDWLLEG